MDKPSRLRSLLNWFAGHPMVGLVGWLASVIGLVLTVWLYLKTIPSREMVLLEPPVRSVFVNREAPRVLDVRVGGEQIQHQDVFAVQLAIWNLGNQSIRPDNVLEPVAFKPAPGSRIVDAQVLRRSREVCGVAVRLRPDNAGAQMDWKILEPEDGAIVQLVIVGDRNCAIKASGTIEGGGKPRFIRLVGEEDKSSRSLWSSGKGFSEWALPVVFAFLFAWVGICLLLKDLPKAWRYRALPCGRLKVVREATFGVILILITLGMVWYYSFRFVNTVSVPRALLVEPAQESNAAN